MQILAGPPPPPPPPCDGCWPTPHETAAAASTASRATFRLLIEPNTLLLLPQRFPSRDRYPLYPDMFYSSPLRKNSFRNTATRSKTAEITSSSSPRPTSPLAV